MKSAEVSVTSGSVFRAYSLARSGTVGRGFDHHGGDDRGKDRLGGGWRRTWTLRFPSAAAGGELVAPIHEVSDPIGRAKAPAGWPATAAATPRPVSMA